MPTFLRNYYRIWPPTKRFRINRSSLSQITSRNVRNPDQYHTPKTQTKRNYIRRKRLKRGSQLLRRRSKFKDFFHMLFSTRNRLLYVQIEFFKLRIIFDAKARTRIIKELPCHHVDFMYMIVSIIFLSELWRQNKQRLCLRFRKMFKKFHFKILLPKPKIVIENLRMMPIKVYLYKWIYM